MLQEYKEDRIEADISKPPPDPATLADSKLPSRSDQKWAYLRDIKEFEKLKGCTVELPQLGGSFVQYPKDMDSAIEYAEKFLITEDRIEVMRLFHTAVQIGQKSSEYKGPVSQQGVILSGPIGVGKSVISYLLACSAYASDCILFYIVSFVVEKSFNFLQPLIQGIASSQDDNIGA